MGKWLPNARRDFPGNDAGPMNGSGAKRELFHSTEGGSISGAVAAYVTNNSWPTITVDIPLREIQQHLPLEVAARSLRNLSSDPGPTNSEGTILVQIEIVGFAKDPSSMADEAGWRWFGAEVVRPIADMCGVPIESTVKWVSYPDSYGAGKGQRLEDDAFRAYQGLFGHEHADENVHGDPGAIPINWILEGARGGDWFDMATKQDLMAVLDEWATVNKVNGGTEKVEELVGWTHWQTYFTYTLGDRLPTICATHDDPNRWFAMNLAGRFGPFTAQECEDLVTDGLAAYAQDTNPSWRAHMCHQWVMDMVPLIYEHIPVEPDPATPNP